MIRFIQHNFDNIKGIDIYPIISMLLFLTIFIIMLFIVIKLPKNNVDEASNYPLDND